LHSFSSSLPKAVDMLAALQVQHLTCVELGFDHDAMTDSSALSMALALLSNLQQLHTGNINDATLSTALTTLVRLPHLTLLQFNGTWPLVVHWQDEAQRRRVVPSSPQPMVL
jgi:hypothetical protein